jgi:hypothetical protein
VQLQPAHTCKTNRSVNKMDSIETAWILLIDFYSKYFIEASDSLE